MVILIHLSLEAVLYRDQIQYQEKVHRDLILEKVQGINRPGHRLSRSRIILHRNLVIVLRASLYSQEDMEVKTVQGWRFNGFKLRILINKLNL